MIKLSFQHGDAVVDIESSAASVASDVKAAIDALDSRERGKEKSKPHVRLGGGHAPTLDPQPAEWRGVLHPFCQLCARRHPVNTPCAYYTLAIQPQ